MRAWWLLLAISGVTGSLILCVVFVDWGASVVVRDVAGRVVSRPPLPDSGSFEIEYTHSYYGAPTVERFSANPRGGFNLVEISSPSEAVLDYYELEGRKTTDGEWTHLTPSEPRHFEELSLIGTEKGRKTLVLPGRRVPLFAKSGAPVHLTLRVEEDGFLTELREALSGWRTPTKADS